MIDVDIFVLPTSHSNKNASNVIFIVTKSKNGVVKTRLVSSYSFSVLAGSISLNDGDTFVARS